MLILDSNILLYAYNGSSEFHVKSKNWIEKVFTADEVVGLPWITILAFARLSTSPRIFSRPYSAKEVCEIISSWFVETSVVTVEPTEKHWLSLEKIIKDCQVTSKLMTDAHLAALALEHNATICSNDKDFLRFKGLKIFNPVEEF